MRTAFRRIDPGLIQQLFSTPHRFEFFQTVRLLELLFANRSDGGTAESVCESIRFRNSIRLAFAPGEVEALQVHWRSDEAGQVTDEVESVGITTSFIGMLGNHGVLPAHYTERIAERERYQKDGAARAFLDVFSNRSVGQFYRAWKKYRLPVCYEQNRSDQFLPLILAVTGLGFGALRGRFCSGPGLLDDESLAHFAGVLRQRPLSAVVLKDVLSAYFAVPIRVEQFVGKWYSLAAEQRSTLGSASAVLGRSALVGGRVWQRDLRIRLWVGPLAADEYASFLPTGERAAALKKLLSFATGHQFEYEIRPVLRASDVRQIRLGGGPGPRLGHDSFLITRPSALDRDDCAFDLHSNH